MAIALVATLTPTQSKSAGTTLTITHPAIAAGETIIVGMVWDNTGASTPTITGVTVGAGESAAWAFAAQWTNPTATSGGGIMGAVGFIKTTVAWGAGTKTITFSASITAKVNAGYVFSGMATPQSSATSGANATSSSVTGPVRPTDGAVIYMQGVEGITIPATSGGAPPSTGPTTIATSGSTAQTNLSIRLAYALTGTFNGSATVLNPGFDNGQIFVAFAGVPMTYPVSGTVPVTVGASGAATRVPRVHQVSGTVAVTTGASGAATIAVPTGAQHTVFDATPAETFTAYNDGQDGIWTGNQFYTYGSPAYEGWTLVGVRIYIPASTPSGMLTTPGKVSWAMPQPGDDYWTNDDTPSDALNRLMETGNQATFSTLTTGWNNILFPTPFAWTHARGAFVGISWNTGGFYVHAFPSGPEAFFARDGTRLVRAEHQSTGLQRGVHNAGGNVWASAAYGLDILLAEPGGAPSPKQVSGTVAVTTGAAGVISANFQAMQWVEVRRNIALNPVATNFLGGFSPNNVYWDRTFVTSVPAPHPQGITTAAMVQNNGGGALSAVASLYNVDLLANTGPARYWGAWFYVDAPGYQAANMLGYVVDLPANQWTWLTFPQLAAGQWSGVEIFRPSGTPAGSDKAWITGVTAFPSTIPTEALWGDQVVSGARISWAGTPNASESIRQEPVVKTVVATGASGAVTIPSGAIQHQVSGTVAVTTAVTGAATVHSRVVHQVSGTVAVSTGASGAVVNAGAPCGWPSAWPASGQGWCPVAVTHQVSGTVPVNTAATGAVAKRSQISGSVPVTTTVGGAVTRVPITHQVSGVVPVTTAASGAATRVPLTLPVAGVVPVVTAASGNVTLLVGSVQHQVSGVVPVVTAASGNPTRVALTHQVSGVVPVTTAATGAIASRLPVSGLVPVVTATSGSAMRVPIAHQVSGTVAVTTNSTGVISANFVIQPYTEIRRNLAMSPYGIAALPAYQLGPTITGNVAVADHPEGITTANRFTFNTSAVNPGLDFAGAVVPVGQQVTLSAWVKLESGSTNPYGLALKGQAGETNRTLTVGVWERISWTVVGSGIARVPGFRRASNAATGSVLITGMLVEYGPTMGTIFSGDSTGAPPDQAYTWQGTRDGSDSMLYTGADQARVVVTPSGVIGSASRAVSGTVDVVTAASGAISKPQSASGTVAVLTGASGAIASRQPVSGTAAVTVGVSGTPSSKQNVSGVVAVVTTVSGNALPPGGTSGTVPVTIGVSGAVTSRQGLAGTPVAVTTGVSGAVTSRQRIAGTVSVTVGVSGAVQINPRGRVDVLTGVSGAVTQVHQVSGRVDVATAVSGQIGGGQPLSGTAAVTTSVSGAATVVKQVSGVVSVVTTVSGTLAGRVYSVSGTVEVLTNVSGEPGAILSVSGIVPVLTTAYGRVVAGAQPPLPPWDIALIPLGPGLWLRGAGPALTLAMDRNRLPLHGGAGGYPLTNENERLTLKGTR